MEDQEIYKISEELISSIVHDLSEGIYKQLNGQLKIAWGSEKKVSAWAESNGDIDSPPDHRIVITYELARKLYRDIEAYYQYASNEFLHQNIQRLFQAFDPKPNLPNHLNEVNTIRNIFIGSLTWVFFHELGHLKQEHGYIRKLFGASSSESFIEDCEAAGIQTLDSRTAAIYHVTELAADVEATVNCVLELVRHFLPQNQSNSEDDLTEFRNNLFLMICGVSCALYRFHGNSNPITGPTPTGSHPTPIRRLESFLPNIYERLDAVGENFHGLSRKQLVCLCAGAANSVALFWLHPYLHPLAGSADFMMKGILQDPYKSYWIEIIKIWDEIHQEVIKVRRYGNDFELLSFTEELRTKMLS